MLGTPAVLVPLPIATDDHQRLNAEALVSAGQARVVPDADLDAERLLAEIDAMSMQADRTVPSTGSGATFGRADSAQRVARLVIQHSAAVPEGVARPTERAT